MSESGQHAAHHETKDVNLGSVLIFAVGLLVLAALINMAVWLLFVYFSKREATVEPRTNPLAAAEQSRVPPEPRLQTNPREDLRDFRNQEERILNGYAWVDKDAGIVRIPIEEAKRLVIERGLPARKAATK